MLRKIIVPVRGDGKGDNVFAHAAVLAKRFKAHVVVAHCRPRPEDLLPYGVPIPAFMKDSLFEQSRKVADQEEQGLRNEVAVLAKKFKIRITNKPAANSASASWVEESGRQVDVIKRHGRLADLIAVAKPDVDRNLGSNTLKAALFHTGRPVMMCPPTKKVTEKLGQNITIAWNGSEQASRAVALTLDLLAKAKTVTVLSSGTEPNGARSADLIEYLTMRGINANLKRFSTQKSIGNALLDQSSKIGADMMIMGAYGDSHERETLFGGNTQTVVDHAKMPVVLVH